MMNKNMNSPTKLTEFAPLSPEEGPPVVASIFSKIFSFAKSSPPSNSQPTSPSKEEPSPVPSADTWKQPESNKKSPMDDNTSMMSYSLDASEGRSLPNVLKRISNIVASKSNNLQSYKDSQLRSYWMPDSVSKQCYECGERFTTFRRRHHCRVCGQIFCSKCCSDEIPGKIMGCTGDLRVCTYCCKVVLSYLQSSDMRSDLSADLKALQEDLEEKYGSNSPPISRKNTNEIAESENSVHRKPSVGYMEEKYAFRRPTQNYLTAQERTLALQNSASLRMIYEELFRSNQAIILQTHRIRLNRYYNCFLGNELVNWMITHNKAATRVQATAIGQALFQASFIEPVLLDNSFSDSSALFKPAKLSRVQNKDFLVENQASCDAQEPAWVKTIPQHDSTTDSESESKQSPQSSGRVPSSSSSYYLDLNLEASTVTLKKPTSEDLTSSVGEVCNTTVEHKEVNFQSQENNCNVPDDLLNDKLLVQDVKEKEGWHRVSNLKNAFGESTVYDTLTSAYKQHKDSLLKQLLNKEGLSQNWSKVVLQVAHQIVDHVRPDLHHDTDDMDIRQYVQIKKSPGGSKNDCEIVSGVVCSKNVAHKGMNAMIANPKILLLRCGLMYQRVERKLLSLEPVMLQESEYLGHAVARINALGPDIVLVHRSVSRLAQDKLRECGITLVLNVKLSILERLARCTGASIVDTIDAHINARYRLGVCKKFYLRNFPSEKTGIKTLMYFEGCANPHLGATILLRGASQNELRKVKNVASVMIFAAYSCRLEKSFLMDEFAKPPSSMDNSFQEETSRNGSPSKTKELTINGQRIEEEKESISDQLKKQSDDDEVISSNDSRIFESQEPKLNYSTPRGSVDKEKSTEIPGEDDDFDQVSTLLMNTASSYDTLKLFKSKSKSSLEESKVLKEKLKKKKKKNSQVTLSTNAEASEVAEEHDTSFDLFRNSASDPSSEDRAEKLKSTSSFSKEIPEQEKRSVHGESVSDKSDPLHQYLNEDEDEVFDELSPSGQCLSVADLPLLNKFKKALEGTILSVSPYLKFSIPYLETEPGRNCVLRSFFPKELYYSALMSTTLEGTDKCVAFTLLISKNLFFFPLGTKSSNSNATGELSQYENSQKKIKFKPAHEFIEAKLTSSADSREVQSLVALYRADGCRLDHEIKAPASSDKRQFSDQSESVEQPQQWPDCLDPANHQRLSVLFCSFLCSTTTNSAPAFCVNPWVVNMDLYGRNDIALGRFLERYCLTTEYKCPAQDCKALVDQHVRRFVHDGGCVHISLCQMSDNPFANPGQENSQQIFMWSKCRKCKSVSPVVPISDDTWSLSFAKYLELRFHGGVYTRRGTDTCQHSLHYDQHQYFCKRNMLAVMSYSRISQWEISLPPPLIEIIYDSRFYANVVDDIKSLALKGDEVFSSVKEKLSCLQVDEGLTSAMKVQLVKDQQYFKTKMEELQLKLTSPTLENKRAQGKHSEKHVQTLMYRIEDNIVIIQRLISETVFNWNAKLAEAMAKKKDEKQSRNKLIDRSILTTVATTTTSSVTTTTTTIVGIPLEADDYITEDTASESQLEDLSPVSADYNAVEAIAALQAAESQAEFVENSDTEQPEPLQANLEDTAIVQGSPKAHQRTFSDATISSTALTTEDAPDKKKKKKTILSQLLTSTVSNNVIEDPFDSSEHHLLPLGSVVPIVVYEREPSSIIAYALDSHDYKHALQEQLRTMKGPEMNPSPLNRRKLQDTKENNTEANQPVELKRPSVLSFLRGNSPNPNTLSSPVEPEKSIPPAEGSITVASGSLETEDEKKASKQQQQQNYIEVQFTDSTSNFYCRIYFAAQFAALRECVLPCGEDGYTRSLSRSILWAARGGKSGSAFSKTQDDRFVLKEMTRVDLQIFLDFAPNYFAYMEKCQQTKQPTLLGKIVGIYRVSFKNNATGNALRTSVLVMENLFYNRTITGKFDLKGSVRNRHVNPDEIDHEGELVLLDENLLNMSCDSPLYVRPHAKAVLTKAIEEDTKFLADNCVMDYSLLVGLEPNSDELVLGIIDYLRTFTWDKRLETFVKKSGILGGQGKLPTIVSPVEYRVRFIAAMHKYFLPVPDRWTGLNRGVIATS
ncbi:1-phosphatidylinositol 3-phosphate 5-kinase [Copidosoma floridanum]|uniref:1-phosphatidylinositol 3-phosphate 5-kinase n=1 Tax=Copidosoma floridanum TaxID=29053 RepID=UPI000C6FC172|nr:1-phosphatidylinositol 3-phosphate 5-kinase [Copidosoma floridanum]